MNGTSLGLLDTFVVCRSSYLWIELIDTEIEIACVFLCYIDFVWGSRRVRSFYSIVEVIFMEEARRATQSITHAKDFEWGNRLCARFLDL